MQKKVIGTGIFKTDYYVGFMIQSCDAIDSILFVFLSLIVFDFCSNISQMVYIFEF